MVALARLSNGATSVSLASVAEQTKLSRRYLEQLAIALKNAGLIRGLAGKGGGYQLTRQPIEISLGQIVEASIGPINIVDCLKKPDICLEADYCECRWVFQTINERILNILNDLYLDDLVDQPIIDPLGNEVNIRGSSCPTQINHSTNVCKEDERCR